MTDLEKMQLIIIDSSCHFEYLYSFIDNVKKEFPNLTKQELKNKVLYIIRTLLLKNILYVGDTKTYNKFDLSTEDSIKRIDEMWFEKASYIDFLNMVFFSRTEWFHQKLESKGYNFKDNWQEYVENNTWLKKILEINNNELELNTNHNNLYS